MTSSISKFIQRAQERITLSSLFGSKLKLQQRGREYIALCPFHNEKTPSFTIVDDKNFYYCFGCGAHGTAYNYFTDYLKLEPKAALEELSKLSNIPLPDQSNESSKAYAIEDRYYQLNIAAGRWFIAQLEHKVGTAARDYLAARQILGSIAKRFGLGFAPPVKGAMVKHLTQGHGFKIEELVAVGLVVQRDDGSVYERFGGRLMFPIINIHKQVVGFGGRSLTPDQQPKYLNSPESLVFHKQYVFYGESLIKRPVKQLIICEGYTDVIGLNQAGINNVIAPLGTSINNNHLRRALRFSNNILVCLDGDNAGQQAAFKVCKIFLSLIKPGDNIRFVVMPSGQDPEEMVKGNKSAFMELLQSAITLSEFCFGFLVKTIMPKQAEQFAYLEQQLMQLADEAQDQILKKNIKSYFSNRLYHFQRSTANQLYRVQNHQTIPPETQLPKLARDQHQWQRQMMAMLIANPFLLKDNDNVSILEQLCIVDKPLDKLRYNMFNHILGITTNIAAESFSWPSEITSDPIYPQLLNYAVNFKSDSQCQLSWQILVNNYYLEQVKKEFATVDAVDKKVAMTSEISRLTNEIKNLKLQII